jgi:NitT/TauT family transport system substrate-binding protein
VRRGEPGGLQPSSAPVQSIPPATPKRAHRAPVALAGLVALLFLAACAPGPSAAPAPAPGGAGSAPAASPSHPAAAGAPAPVKLRAGFTSISGAMAALWAAHDGGYFTREGLEVEITSFPSGNEGIQALMANEVDFLSIAGATTVSAALGGGDTLVLATFYRTLVQSLTARPEIVQPEDLRGKAVGISRLGTTIDTGARIALRHFGLEPDRDVAIVQAGAMANIVGSMEAGRVQAGILGYPSLSLGRRLGFHQLLDIGTLGVPYASTGASARRSYVAQNPDIVRRYLRAVIAGAIRLADDKAFAFDVYRPWLRTDDEEVLEETWEIYAVKYLSRVPIPDDHSIQGVLDELSQQIPAARTANARDFYDDRFVRELDETGYIRGLSRQ